MLSRSFVFVCVFGLGAFGQLPERCTLPKDSGESGNKEIRYFFNKDTGKCKKLKYKGQGGNENNFSTKELCVYTCTCQCRLPRPGNDGTKKRYFFNTKAGQCQEFLGKKGKGNNFKSFDKCHQMCSPCMLPKDTGPCKAAFPKFYYNSQTQLCEQFIYGGCRGNDNRFGTLADCNSACRCSLPKVKGRCKARIPSYYFDAETQMCKDFDYGGCEGNANRFGTITACNATCACPLPKAVGPCEALHPSYYFNADDKKCEEFNYGGCEGNGNRFDSTEACQAGCTCLLPIVPGMCKAYFPRFAFNSETGKCEQFIYGGCGGNANRFENENQCISTCISS